MSEKGQRLVLREGNDWMELCGVGSGSDLWLETGGTVGMPGDIVSVPRLGLLDPDADSGAIEGISPFEAEIVVDSVTGAVLLPESRRIFNPRASVLWLIGVLIRAGLTAQTKIVLEWWLRLPDTGEDAHCDAA